MKLKQLGSTILKRVMHLIWARRTGSSYDRYFSYADQSDAHAAFCEEVYGKNLCQHGMMDMEQLEKLLEVLNLNENNRVLEIGCGNGFITEYISDLTGAEITGIDYSSVAVQKARDRAAASNKKRLTFLRQDMNKLDFPPGSFDTIIVLDSIHYARDMDAVTAQMKRIATSSGQMGIFFTQRLFAEDSQDLLIPENTDLSKALKKNNLDFKMWNFTEEEKQHWRKKVAVLEKLESQFKTENDRYLYNFRCNEAKRIVQGRIDNRCRCLYHVKCGNK